jgi:hypothetical protein
MVTIDRAAEPAAGADYQPASFLAASSLTTTIVTPLQIFTKAAAFNFITKVPQ